MSSPTLGNHATVLICSFLTSEMKALVLHGSRDHLKCDFFQLLRMEFLVLIHVKYFKFNLSKQTPEIVILMLAKSTGNQTILRLSAGFPCVISGS